MSAKPRDLSRHRMRLFFTLALAATVMVYSSHSRAQEPQRDLPLPPAPPSESAPLPAAAMPAPERDAPASDASTISALSDDDLNGSTEARKYLDEYLESRKQYYAAEIALEHAKADETSRKADLPKLEKDLKRLKSDRAKLDSNTSTMALAQKKRFDLSIQEKEKEITDSTARNQRLADAVASQTQAFEEVKGSTISEDEFYARVRELKKTARQAKRTNKSYAKASGTKAIEKSGTVAGTINQLKIKMDARARTAADIQFEENKVLKTSEVGPVKVDKKAIEAATTKAAAESAARPLPVVKSIAPEPVPFVCPKDAGAQAVQGIVKNLVKDHPEMLSHLFNLSAMKMAYQLQRTKNNKTGKTGLKNVEQFYALGKKQIDSTLSNTDFTKKLTAVYEQYGKKDDLAKIQFSKEKYNYRYGHPAERITNDNASAVVLWLRDEQAARQPASRSAEQALGSFNEIDAASIWAVEKLRSGQESTDKDYAIGGFGGNVLDFSSRVTTYTNAKVSAATLKAAQDAVAAQIEEASAKLSVDLKNCLYKNTGKTCTASEPLGLTAAGLLDVQAALVKSVMQDTDQNRVKIDASRSTVDKTGPVLIYLEEK